LGVDISDVLFGLLSLLEDVVVALVLLQLERLDDEGEVVVYLLHLASVKLLGFDEFLFYCLSCASDGVSKQ